MTDESSTSNEEATLVFQPERAPRFQLRLALMIGASLLVHAASFYVFQVAYTPTGSQLPPPALVTLAPLDLPENGPLARWLAVNDPVLATHAPTPGTGQLLASLGYKYVPSYAAGLPPFKPLEPARVTDNPTPPRANVLGPVPIVSARAPSVATDRAFGQITALTWGGGIAPKANAPMPPVQLRVSETANVLDATTFLVGVRAGRGAPFVFRQTTSGNTAADEYARAYLAALPMVATDAGSSETVWGTATFHWGNEVYR